MQPIKRGSDLSQCADCFWLHQQGDPYVSTYQREKQEFLAKKKQFVTDKAFKPSNPAKKT